MAAMPETATAAMSAAATVPTTSLLDKIVEEQAISRARIAERYKPVMSTEDLVAREQAINYLVENIMREGIDYGWVPGTKPKEPAKPGEYQAKPTLFKSGAERACAFFGYVPEFLAEKQIEEWTADEYGEPLFYYVFRCTLSKDGQAIGQGIGSASTWESKYRYRNGERTCPACGKAAIIKGREEYGGGYVCFGKKGGCGAKFGDNDRSIIDQVVGRIPNTDVADVINTVQKMAQKRSYVAATLTATGLSGRFTQDMEDMPALPETAEQRNTKAEQAEVAQRRIEQERAKAAKQTTESKPASSAPKSATTPTPAPASTVPPNQTARQDLKPTPVPKDDTGTAAIPEPVLAMWKRMTNTKAIIETFAELKRLLTERMGDAADIAYHGVLRKHGVEHSNQFRYLQAARLAAQEMFNVLQDAVEESAREEGGYQATDDDVPDIFNQRGVA